MLQGLLGEWDLDRLRRWCRGADFGFCSSSGYRDAEHRIVHTVNDKLGIDAATS
jgi:hypothetical protein